jgi:hypothetical protein
MEAVRTSETSVCFSDTTPSDIPEDSNLQFVLSLLRIPYKPVRMENSADVK